MAVTDTETTTLVLNGSEVVVLGDHPHLLAALREELGVISPKDGCSPSGQCRCCTVLVGGKAVVSCQRSLAQVAGKEVTTLERASTGERSSATAAVPRPARPRGHEGADRRGRRGHRAHAAAGTRLLLRQGRRGPLSGSLPEAAVGHRLRVRVPRTDHGIHFPWSTEPAVVDPDTAQHRVRDA